MSGIQLTRGTYHWMETDALAAIERDTLLAIVEYKRRLEDIRRELRSRRYDHPEPPQAA